MNNETTHSVRRLELQASETRRQLATTLDSLADNLTPGRMLDEVLAYSRGGGASFVKGLGNAAAANPVPMLLIATGAAMFLSGKGDMGSVGEGLSKLFHRSDSDHGNGNGAGRTGHNGGWVKSNPEASSPGIGATLQSAGESVGGAVRSAGSAVAEGASSVATAASQGLDLAADAVAGVRDAGFMAAEAIGETAIGAANAVAEEAGQLGDATNRLVKEFRDRAGKLMEEQPLVVAATGVIIGAALAAAFPRTQFEDDLMGETSDSVKEAAAEAVSGEVDKARAAATQVVDDVVKAASPKQDGTLSPAAEAAQKAGEDIKNVIQTGSEAADALLTR